MTDWDGSPTLANASKFPDISRGFSKFHAVLLDICFGHYYPAAEHVETIQGTTLELHDRSKLAFMVLVEFASSVEKERNGTIEETHVRPDPHPYDVFVMKTDFGSQTSSISVVLPMKGGKLLWWDGDKTFESLSSDLHVYRLASLAGSARVLECLLSKKEKLCDAAMKREMLIEIETNAMLNQSHDDHPPNVFRRMLGSITGEHQSEHVQSSLLHSLNISQRKAVITVADGRFQEGFFAIQGPPGCGKTTTMVSMISAIAQGMIVTAPSNAAVANLALKIFDTDRFPFGDLCIFGDGCDESVWFLNPRRRSDEQKKALSKYIKIDSVNISPGPRAAELQTEKDRQKDLVRQQFAKWLHLDEDLSMTELCKRCPDIPLDENNSVTKGGSQVVQKILEAAKIILCTLNSSGSSYLQNIVSKSAFKTYLLDEGGQCTEAEFFIATTFPGIKRIIVMGDPNQLRPTVLEPACSSAGFGESWLSRVYKLYPSKVHLLDTQYRMDPIILKFPNKRFYSNRIRSGENVVNRLPSIITPFLFVDTRGRGREERDENLSYRNSYEIAVVRDLLKNDPAIAEIVKENEYARIIIITPYRAQAKLLKDMARILKFANLEVSTVDAFQGQEGDIVILSTVRTKQVGFVDDAQRLNVALTRAKRVLRVVGDSNFFGNLKQGSTLRALVCFAAKQNATKWTKLRRIPSCPPDLSISTRWKITLTQRFHNEISSLPISDKNVALNTLFALALPDLDALGNRIMQKEGWHTSWLKGYKQLRVIWVARNHGETGVIEAHHGGSLESCLHFRQVNHIAPDGCCSPKCDMSGVVLGDHSLLENGRMFISWPLDSQLQDAILSDRLEVLPLSKIQLDPPQEQIARSPPPLLIESRSGTGKTLVLLQHAAFYNRASDPRPALFVTVSQRLRNELEQKYDELTPIHGVGLPKTKFYSFSNFTTELLSHYQILDFKGRVSCTFHGYIHSRRSYEKLTLEPHLLENEIGGVILGSVIAAEQAKALNREQYLTDKRSNIPSHTEEHRKRRDLVFDEYVKYNEWKSSGEKYDIHDVVLRLLAENTQQLFASAYLDEVQDLSHAAIFLICRLAGRDSLHWVLGGDPAQMISPGCSFTFDGLKQTLLKIETGIEKKIKKVEHLVVNYRTTKDILALGNTILSTASDTFPGAIDYAQPERARKDLGLKVVICGWEVAFQSRAKFGDKQAFIYSSNSPDKIVAEATEWLDNHPFILSSLDSKGLEFEDVVVAFEHDRKVWQLERKLEATLSMLRELYVAVTRAQKRLVILIKDENPAMLSFFDDLNCGLEQSDGTIFEEFNCDTSAVEWFERARKLYDNEQFKFAASCFTRAKQQDWACLAQGRSLLHSGITEEAVKKLRKAARLFYEGSDFEMILDILRRLLELHRSTWDSSDDKMFLTALEEYPKAIPRPLVIRYAILREEFSAISVNDLKDGTFVQLLMTYRQKDWLKQLVVQCTETDREEIASAMPLVVVDFHFENHDFYQACRVALSALNYEYAESATESILKKSRHSFDSDAIVRIVELWKENGPAELSKCLTRESTSRLLCELFQSPRKVHSSLKPECTKLFGKDAIILAVDRCELDRTVLLDFSTVVFKEEVESVLLDRFSPDLIDIVEWYDRNGHAGLASDYVKERVKEWTNDELLKITMMLRLRPKWLFQELQQRHLLNMSRLLVVLSPLVREDSKKHYLNSYSVFAGSQKWDGLRDAALECEGEVKKVLAQMRLRRQFVERVFLQIFLKCDLETVARCSWEAIESHELASINLTRLLRLWSEMKQMKDSFISTVDVTTFDGKYTLLMCFFIDVTPTESNLRSLLPDTNDSFFQLLYAVGPAAFAYCKIHKPNMPRCHEDDLLRRFSMFHAELRARLGIRSPWASQTPQAIQVVDSANCQEISKTLSKKAARKQKQQRKTQNQANATTANSANGGGKKKKQNKQKNSKKKSGRKKG